MSAMTWYDHETESLWSQPWGRSIRGELKGVELYLLPLQLTTWKSWKQQYPHTLAMANDLSRLGERRQGFSPDFVVGLLLGGEAKAYYFRDLQKSGVINDHLGDVPVLVRAGEETFQAYVRKAGGRTLTFSESERGLVDEETGSVWDPVRGLAHEGALKGEALQQVPSMSSYDWAWLDFYPDSEFFSP